MEFIFIFDTTSHAIKAEQILQSGGIEVKVMPVPSEIRAGCGIALRVGETFLEKASGMLEAKSALFRAVYSKIRVNNKNVYDFIKGTKEQDNE